MISVYCDKGGCSFNEKGECGRKYITIDSATMRCSEYDQDESDMTQMGYWLALDESMGLPGFTK